MSTTTTNYGMTKPADTEFYNVAVQNNNMDIIDAALGAKAPAGYGYGDALNSLGTFATEVDLETSLTAVIESLEAYGSKQIVFTLTPYGGYEYYATLYKHTNGNASLVATAYSSVVKYSKICSEGVWKPQEWINPPMALSVEYLTIERWNGKAVYTKIIDCGTASNNKQVTVLDAYHNIIRFNSFMPSDNNASSRPMPLINNTLDSSSSIWSSIWGTTLTIWCGSSVSGQVYTQIWYVK